MKKTFAISGLILLGLGIVLLGLGIAPLETHTQIGHKEETEPWYHSGHLEVFLMSGEKCRVEIAAWQSDYYDTYEVSITHVQNDYTILERQNPYEATFTLEFQAPDNGNYDIYWSKLLVSSITAYQIGELIPKYPILVGGVLLLIVGVASLFIGYLKGGQK